MMIRRRASWLSTDTSTPAKRRTALPSKLPDAAMWFLRLIRPVMGFRTHLLSPMDMAGGFVLLVLVQYIPLLTGGIMPLAEPLLSIVAFQIVPLLTVVALISTFFFKMTGRIYVGAFINALFITWSIVAGQATQYGG